MTTKFRATLTVAVATLACAFAVNGQAYAAPSAAAPHPRSVSAPPKAGTPNKMPYQNRLENQQQRLQRGYQNGDITQSEYNHDTKKLNAIQNQERSEMQNGRLTSQERAHLKNKLDKSADRINDQKHYGSPPR